MGLCIGKILKNAREKHHLTQEELARKVGKNRSYISRIESQESNNITLKTLNDIIEKGFGKKLRIDF